MTPQLATTRLEQALGWPQRRVAGLDEVGRGSAAGPLVVSIAVLPDDSDVPAGLTDSKLVSAAGRRQLDTQLRDWLDDYAIGAASAAEVDDLGMTSALGLAAHRALAKLRALPEVLVVDGPYDYVKHPGLETRTQVKADSECVSVAAASILAKVSRDTLMVDLDRLAPGYGLDQNAGYLTPEHEAGVRNLGPTPLHRTTWRWMDAHPQWQSRRRAGSQLTLFGT